MEMEIPVGYPRLAALARRAKEMYDQAGLKRHNWGHISRNFNRARRILDMEPGDVEITLSGVILHDIGYFYSNLKGHALVGAERCPEVLAEFDYDPEEIGRIRHCIIAHDPATGVLPESLEAKIVYDADMLEKAEIPLILSGSWAEVAEEFHMTVPEYAELFISRFKPLLQAGRAYYTESGKRLDNGDLKAIIEFAKRLRKQN